MPKSNNKVYKIDFKSITTFGIMPPFPTLWIFMDIYAKKPQIFI